MTKQRLTSSPSTRPNFLCQISSVKCFLNVNFSKTPNLHGQKAFGKSNLTKKIWSSKWGLKFYFHLRRKHKKRTTPLRCILYIICKSNIIHHITVDLFHFITVTGCVYCQTGRPSIIVTDFSRVEDQI